MRFLRTIEWRSLAGVVVILGLAGGLAGCGSIEPVAPAAAPITDPTQLYMGLTFNHPAVTLSTAPSYNTLQLTATPRDALGSAMPDLPAPVYESRDTTKVTVTADGVVTAVETTEAVEVIATLQFGLVTRADTAVIKVTNVAPLATLASLSIDPVPPDTAIWSMLLLGASNDVLQDGELYTTVFFVDFVGAQTQQLVPRMLDASSNPLSGVPVAYTSLDPAVATIGSRDGQVILRRPGQVRFVARTLVYGVPKADTATFTVMLPLFDQVQIVPDHVTGKPVFSASDIRIRPHGIVVWSSIVTDTVDVVFDNPANVVLPSVSGCELVDLFTSFGVLDPGSACGAGNVLLNPHQDPDADDFPHASIQVRQFPEPGVYPFHSTRLGASGRVIVTTDPGGNPPRSAAPPSAQDGPLPLLHSSQFPRFRDYRTE